MHITRVSYELSLPLLFRIKGKKIRKEKICSTLIVLTYESMLLGYLRALGPST